MLVKIGGANASAAERKKHGAEREALQTLCDGVLAHISQARQLVADEPDEAWEQYRAVNTKFDRLRARYGSFADKLGHDKPKAAGAGGGGGGGGGTNGASGASGASGTPTKQAAAGAAPGGRRPSLCCGGARGVSRPGVSHCAGHGPSPPRA